MRLFHYIKKIKFFILALFLIFLNGCSSDVTKEPPQQPATKTANVVVLLPLSGAYAHIGNNYLKAIELALFEFADKNLKAKILDTKGTFEGTLEALKQVTDVDVILGPVMSTSVDAAAMWALKRGVPVISLNNNFTKAQPGVFVFGIPPQAEVEAMIRYAVTQRMDRFTAILPSGAFGMAIKDALEKSAQGFGVQLVYVYFYSPNLDELPTIMKHMQKKTVDGIFIVNGGQELYTIGNAIKDAKISGRILGTQLWKASDVQHWRQLSGAWYTTAFSSKKQTFERRYFSLYNKEPDTTAYIAYDAMAMLAKLHKLDSGSPFSMTALTNPMGFVGLQGIFKLQQDGNVKRSISIMEISEGSSRLIGTSEGR